MIKNPIAGIAKRKWIRILQFALLFSLISEGCTINRTYLKEGYNENEKTWLKRVAFTSVTSTPASAQTDIQRLFLHVARDYVSHHGDYLIPVIVVDAGNTSLEKICKMAPRLDGYILHEFKHMDQKGSSLGLGMLARMVECRNGSTIWEAEGDGNFHMDDPDLSSLTRSYSERISPSAAGYTAPFYNFVRDLYNSLPEPELNDTDIEEKILLDSEEVKEISRPTK